MKIGKKPVTPPFFTAFGGIYINQDKGDFCMLKAYAVSFCNRSATTTLLSQNKERWKTHLSLYFMCRLFYLQFAVRRYVKIN